MLSFRETNEPLYKCKIAGLYLSFMEMKIELLTTLEKLSRVKVRLVIIFPTQLKRGI